MHREFKSTLCSLQSILLELFFHKVSHIYSVVAQERNLGEYGVWPPVKAMHEVLSISVAMF